MCSEGSIIILLIYLVNHSVNVILFFCHSTSDPVNHRVWLLPIMILLIQYTINHNVSVIHCDTSDPVNHRVWMLPLMILLIQYKPQCECYPSWYFWSSNHSVSVIHHNILIQWMTRQGVRVQHVNSWLSECVKGLSRLTSLNYLNVSKG